MRNVAVIALMMTLLLACSQPTTNYQATIVSQQGTMIALMQTTTPTRTPTVNNWYTPIPDTDDMTLDAISTLVAVESDEFEQGTNPATTNPYNQDIFQSMGRLVELQSTSNADTRKRFKKQSDILYQDAKLQATMIKQNRTIITAIAQLNTQQTNLQSTSISQHSKITTQIDTLSQQSKTLINYNATAVSLSRTAIVLAQLQNRYLDDIDEELSDQTRLLLRICRNTAQSITEYNDCSR